MDCNAPLEQMHHSRKRCAACAPIARKRVNKEAWARHLALNAAARKAAAAEVALEDKRRLVGKPPSGAPSGRGPR